MPVIFERMIRRRWNLLQKQCLFISVPCTSNLPQPQQTAHILNMQVIAVLALWEQHAVLYCPLDCQTWHLQIPFFGGYLKDRVYRKISHNVEALKGNFQLEITKTENGVLWRKADNMQCCFQGVSCREQWPFPIFDVKSSNSL